MLGRSWEVLAREQQDGELYQAIARCMHEGGTWQGRLVNHRKDGEPSYPGRDHLTPAGLRGRITHYVAVKRDVTEQERAAAALRASEASYRALVETQTEFVLRQQPDGRLNFVNEAYCRYVGKPREQLLDASWNDLLMIAVEDRAAYIRHLRALTPTQPTAAAELRAILPNGAERWEQWVDTGIFDDDGLLIEVQSVGRDITERKRSELALRESEARYRALVETQTEFVLRQLPEGRLTFVNEAYCRYVGKPREFLLSEALQRSRHDGAGGSPSLRGALAGAYTANGRRRSWRRARSCPMGRCAGSAGSTRASSTAAGGSWSFSRPAATSPTRRTASWLCGRARRAIGRWSRVRPSSFCASTPTAT